jgi:hypothetical protein
MNYQEILKAIRELIAEKEDDFPMAKTVRELEALKKAEQSLVSGTHEYPGYDSYIRIR